MNIPSVSIIIPVYNSQLYIAETILSALKQNWPNKEVIIIDDGSSDSSLAIAKSFENEIVKVLHQENRGASAARNYGLREAKGEYIQFLDSDDIMSPTKIENQLRSVTSHEELLFTNWSRFRTPFHSCSDYKQEISLLRETVFSPKQFFEKNYMVPIHSWLCHRSLILKAGRWDESLSLNDDGEFFTRVIAECRTLRYVPGIVYYRSELGESLSRQTSYEALFSLYKSCVSYKDVIQKFESDILNNITKERFAEVYLRALCNNVTQLSDLVKKELNGDLRHCYYMLRKSSRFIVSIIGLKRFLLLKTLINKLKI